MTNEVCIIYFHPIQIKIKIISYLFGFLTNFGISDLISRRLKYYEEEKFCKQKNNKISYVFGWHAYVYIILRPYKMIKSFLIKDHKIIIYFS